MPILAGLPRKPLPLGPMPLHVVMRHSEQTHCRDSNQCTRTEKRYRQRKRQQDQSNDFTETGDCQRDTGGDEAVYTKREAAKRFTGI